ncbi:hypothetical protein [uncultured Anaerovibrio sp.]|uniref:hypothetical protein n=1 Tax=uncultured Anaerovibrio sp. TaxID=361586 RepID=UPI0025D35524|nr:hypothetical protein [uncultured Anaerovibrio sp.]
MDILSFVNSKDIRDYLHEIDYKCDTMQAAWLVYQSANKTMEEKHTAYRWIIDNMPDCPMPERQFSINRDSLHDFLREHMDFCEKHELQLSQLAQDPCLEQLSAVERDVYRYAFESRWYCFPTPFKKGDLVYRFCEKPHKHDLCAGVFVLDGITNGEEDIKRCVHGDASDMNAYGWFQDEDGTVYQEVMFNYMDLVKYKGELYGQERILIAISNFVQGKLEFELLLQSQRTLMMRDYGEYWIPKWYTDEGLELAGLNNLPKMTWKQKRANKIRRREFRKYYNNLRNI